MLDWCPVCSIMYISEHTVTLPNNRPFVVRECSNRHSWKSHILEKSQEVSEQRPPAFENAYRPLHNTVEPVKRLFHR